MLSVPSIASLSRYDTDGSLVIRTIIARWLYLEIFSRGLSGIFPRIEGLLDAQFLERAAAPKRSTLERRRWYQLTYASIVALPNYPQAREARATQLATSLEQLFAFLHPADATYERVLKDIIVPAMRLQERAALTVQQHNFNFYDFPEDPTNEFLEQFAGMADKAITCKDITRDSRTISFTDGSPEELAKKALPICCVGPLITFRDPEKDPESISLTRRALVICTSGDRTQHLQNVRPSLFHSLFEQHSKR
ncbi:hypothetical protein F4805DRAFT_449450 [Annulohypoxylon moriforme]|nr:hypothetical protein F4805DRAFT_449450 [Annulohypoxylon moriforme]